MQEKIIKSISTNWKLNTSEDSSSSQHLSSSTCQDIDQDLISEWTKNQHLFDHSNDEDRDYENQEKRYLSISITDNGFGISKEHQKNMFQLFGNVKFKNNVNKQGIGLGLTTSHRICKYLGGALNLVRSKKNEGTKLQFYVLIDAFFQEQNLSGERENKKFNFLAQSTRINGHKKKIAQEKNETQVGDGEDQQNDLHTHLLQTFLKQKQIQKFNQQINASQNESKAMRNSMSKNDKSGLNYDKDSFQNQSQINYMTNRPEEKQAKGLNDIGKIKKDAIFQRKQSGSIERKTNVLPKRDDANLSMISQHQYICNQGIDQYMVNNGIIIFKNSMKKFSPSDSSRETQNTNLSMNFIQKIQSIEDCDKKISSLESSIYSDRKQFQNYTYSLSEKSIAKDIEDTNNMILKPQKSSLQCQKTLNQKCSNKISAKSQFYWNQEQEDATLKDCSHSEKTLVGSKDLPLRQMSNELSSNGGFNAKSGKNLPYIQKTLQFLKNDVGDQNDINNQIDSVSQSRTSISHFQKSTPYSLSRINTEAMNTQNQLQRLNSDDMSPKVNNLLSKFATQYEVKSQAVSSQRGQRRQKSDSPASFYKQDYNIECDTDQSISDGILSNELLQKVDNTKHDSAQVKQGPSKELPQILIVDDTPFNIYIGKTLIESSFNISCDQAISGFKAIELFRHRAENNLPGYKFVLMDINMPEMDGVITTKRIKHNWSSELKEWGTKIAAHSAIPQEQFKDYVEKGFDEYLPKPLDLKVLKSHLIESGLIEPNA